MPSEEGVETEGPIELKPLRPHICVGRSTGRNDAGKDFFFDSAEISTEFISSLSTESFQERCKGIDRAFEDGSCWVGCLEALW